ncbi:ferritin [Sorangium cellulosum]|uniref:Ferritin n=1 Tax=Sorangium cellulosum TaxID=56 RepID=A0A2L0EHG3_SORCE|nr:ferritin-like domain-containing protein [Sorangium cellulosum]AUX38731.1 ferritin [Sorangium cellulosum]
MRSSRPIDKILRQVLSLSLAPLAGGCGIDTSGFEPIPCTSDHATQYLAGVAPSEPADYLELREFEAFTEAPEVHTRESIGEKCSAATDRAACEMAVAAATPRQGFSLGECGPFCDHHILIVNKGDEVTVIDTPDGVRAWLGPVDTPADAVLAASIAGYNIGCGSRDTAGVKAAGDGYEVLATQTTSDCTPYERTLYVLSVGADGAVRELESEVIESEDGGCVGRRPAGLVRRGGRGATRVGAYFANIAQLEAASVWAFEALGRELAHHGAPRPLVERARIAERDEVRHARVMRRVAARYGGRWQEPRVDPRPVRSLEELALDNAAEGCVRETYGALVGMWQARSARDPLVRRVMTRIARDETRHAKLSWAIDAWVRPRLSPAERRRVEEARRGALDAIAEEAGRVVDRALVVYAGIPGEQAASRLARNFVEAVAASS